jgi:hypothetical protein
MVESFQGTPAQVWDFEQGSPGSFTAIQVFAYGRKSQPALGYSAPKAVPKTNIVKIRIGELGQIHGANFFSASEIWMFWHGVLLLVS